MKSGTKQAKTLRKIISNALICILYCRWQNWKYISCIVSFS
jgi:hypothetical protein